MDVIHLSPDLVADLADGLARAAAAGEPVRVAVDVDGFKLSAAGGTWTRGVGDRGDGKPMPVQTATAVSTETVPTVRLVPGHRVVSGGEVVTVAFVEPRRDGFYDVHVVDEGRVGHLHVVEADDTWQRVTA